MTSTILPIKKPVDPANPKYYLSKPDMHAALVDYKKQCLEAKDFGQEQPGVSNYLGECFLKIARGLALRHNFRGYSFINEMISDSVVTCLKYVRSYDPDRVNSEGQATSPLAYFSQCCHFAMVNRIKLEAKQTRVKRALIYSADLDSFSTQDEDSGEFQMNLNEFISGLGTAEVEAMVKKPIKQKTEGDGGLDEFM